jgi:hypothetical protein
MLRQKTPFCFSTTIYFSFYFLDHNQKGKERSQQENFWHLHVMKSFMLMRFAP